MLESVRPNKNSEPSMFDKLIRQAERPLKYLSQQYFFPRFIVGVAIAYGFISIAAAAFFFAGATIDDVKHLPSFLKGDESDVVGGLSALAAAVCALLATIKYRQGNHLRAYRLFELGLLINIFIGQVVLFLKSQGVALVWLAVTLLLLVNLNLLRSEESHHKKSRSPTAPKSL
jgi:uncharacterized membrane protein YfcA